MPAVDPTRLSAQIRTVLERANVPNEFARELAELVGSYTDRRRSGEQVTFNQDGYRSNPVALRTIKQEVQSAFRNCPEGNLELARALWRRAATRLFAPGMIKGCSPDLVQSMAQEWASETQESDVLNELASVIATSASWQIDEAAFFEWLIELQHSGSEGGSILVLKLMTEAVLDPQFEALHKIVRMLRGYARTDSTQLRAALIRLCKQMAARSPAEAVKFLKSEFADHPDSTRWLLSGLEHHLSGRFRHEIGVVLSTSGGAGIIRRKLVKD
jgi:hypothetical protein